MQDVTRQRYLHDHLEALGQARQRGADNVRGYFVWSLLDNLEWSSGYAMKFGLAMVQRPSMQRIPKHSMLWYRLVMAAHKMAADASAAEQDAENADSPTEKADGPAKDPVAAQTHAHWRTPADEEGHEGSRQRARTLSAHLRAPHQE